MPADDTAVAMELLIAFVNTHDLDNDTDALATPEDLRTWLHSQGLLASGARVTAQDVAEARALRAGLRTALLAHDGHAEATATAPVETSIDLRLVIAADGSVVLAPADDGVAAALARIVAPIPAAAADGTWMRVKACPKSSCQWAFYDQSRNRSRRWCSMEVCGNQEKTRSFRDRQRVD